MNKYRIFILLLSCSCIFVGCATPARYDRWYDSNVNNEVRCSTNAVREGVISDRGWETLVLHLKHLGKIQNPVVIQKIWCFGDPCIAVRLDLSPFGEELRNGQRTVDTVQCIRLPDGSWITCSIISTYIISSAESVTTDFTFARDIDLSETQPLDEEDQILFVRLSPDGKVTIRSNRTGKLLTSDDRGYFPSEEFGTSGLRVIKVNHQNKSVKLCRIGCKTE